MASSMTAVLPNMASTFVSDHLAAERRVRQQRIAEITEMIHVSCKLRCLDLHPEQTITVGHLVLRVTVWLSCRWQAFFMMMSWI